MKSVGIDIGTSSIKIVEVTSTNKGVTVTQFTEHPINTNPGFDPEIEIIEFLRNFVSTYDLATTRFVCALRQEQVSIRTKVFPFTDRQKILKSLPFELEEDLPFSNETAIFDAKIIRMVGTTAEVLACAAPKSRVASTLEKMQDIGVNISLLSAEGVAFANCFERWDAPIATFPAAPVELDQEQPIRNISITVHIGHTRTLVCAFENGLLIGVRSVLWGGKNIADAISRRYEIPYVEALKEMQSKAFILPSREGASYDQIVFSDTISQQVKELSKDLKISILEFKAEFNGNVQSVSLTGGTSQILNLHAYLTQQLELPVNRTSVLSNFNQLAFERTSRTDAIIGVALGLAIEGLKKPRNPAVNFMKGEFAVQNTFFKIFWERWGTVVQISAAAFVVFFIYSMFRESAALNLADRTTEALKAQAKSVAQLPSKSQNEAGVKKYIRDQKKRATELRTVENLTKMNSALDIIKKINDAIPNKPNVVVDVSKLTVNENRVQIEGIVANARQFTLLESALSNISQGGVQRVQPQTTTRVKKSGIPFGFAFRVDRGIQSKVQ